MAHTGPGKAHRDGISLLQLAEMFPTEEAARKWFESTVWPAERFCPRCASVDTHECSHAKMPYRCRDCRKYFSVKTGTVMAGSPLPLRKWVYAIYLDTTSLKGVASMKLHRDIGVTQKTAWFMQQRIREAFAHVGPVVFAGPVEVDETYVGGLERNRHARDKKRLGRGPVGKTAVVGMKDRETKQVTARVVERTDAETLQGFVGDHAAPGATVYTDESRAYDGLANRETVKHSVSEYVRGMAHTNGVESFWSMLKRAHKGTFHHLSAKHLQRYVNEFAGRHNIRDADTLDQMRHVVARIVGRRLMYRDLIA
ncbi:IS1595 family transposase [Candidatus Palauibacter sp.]|uniref:IS1595 family transposase n=1 Tax=Candidatus Palauibacter sp. TaxID=3101350 RepID=UPI003B523287